MRQQKRAPRFRRLPDRKDTMVSSMVLPIALHRRMVIAAHDLNWPLAEVVRVAVTEWLDNQERRATR